VSESDETVEACGRSDVRDDGRPLVARVDVQDVRRGNAGTTELTNLAIFPQFMDLTGPIQARRCDLYDSDVANAIKNAAKKALPRSWWDELRRLRVLPWRLAGRPVPPPQVVKELAIWEYGKRSNIRTFVETGTFGGGMVDAMKDRFAEIYTIELDQIMYGRAARRFADLPNIHVIQGDSTERLPNLLKRLSGPCVFWLDAHYSSGETARGELDTPIVAELKAILAHHERGHAILVDDARHFTGSHDYPTVAWIQDFVATQRPDLVLEVSDDIIRIHPTA
jgi:hypothetical protein